MPTRAAVIVPMKPFSAAKGRLAQTLAPSKRASLAREMAQVVLQAAAPLPVLVVCDHDEVATWARQQEAMVLFQKEPGLNNAVQEAFQYLREAGFSHVIVAHGDLPLAQDLAWLAEFEGVTIVPDRHRQGTNVMSVPTSAAFVFGYGPGSFAYHLDHVQALGLPYRVVEDAALGWDVDEPRDLSVLSRPSEQE